MQIILRSLIVCLFILSGFAVAADVKWTVTREDAVVKGGRTVMPVRVEFRNSATSVRTLAATVKVIDYYQQVVAEKTAVYYIGPAAAQAMVLPIVTDQAGSYVKVNVEGMESAGPFPSAIHDEQIVFTDMLTGPRMQLSLNGAWEVSGGDPMKMTPPVSGPWEKCELPFRSWTWGRTHTKWFRKTFVLPPEYKGKQIELQLGGVRFRADIFLNGQSLGGFDTDQMPLRVNLNKAARPGEKNELLLAVTDWLSCVAPELKSSLVSSTLGMGQGIPGRPFIRPCTGADGAVGISDPIYLVGLPQIALEKVYITPSVRKAQITVKTVIHNGTNLPQTADIQTRVMDKEQVLFAGKTQTLALQPGRNEIEEVISVDTKKIAFWSPGKPRLYRLRSSIGRGEQPIDQLDTRFGYREFWVEGEVFKINGISIKPAVGAGWPYSFPCIENTSVNSSWYAGKKFLRSFMDLPATMFRYHTEPFPILMYDMADELGLMIVSEGMMSSIPGNMKVDDPRLWKNLREFYPQWVLREFNHPCLVIRSIENEMGYFLAPPGVEPCARIFPDTTVRLVEKELKKIGREVKRLDPSRPIMYDGGGPIFYDLADIYNPHYPHLEGFPGLWPIPSRWISMPVGSYYLKRWQWDRKKPLYVGEYGMFSQRGPESSAGFLGNDAYVKDWCVLSQITMWKMSMEGYRIDGVTAAYPWTMLEMGGPMPEVNDSNPRVKIFHEGIAPIATFIHQYRSCYFGGRSIRRTLTTINDTLETKDIDVQWKLVTANGKILQQDRFAVNLTPAQRKETHISLALPIVSQRAAGKLIVETFSGKKLKLKHHTERDLAIFPVQTSQVKVASRIGVVGLSDEVFSKLNVSVLKLDIKKLDLTGIDVLFVSGRIKKIPGYQGRIEKFIRSGGRVIVLVGSEFPEYLPFKLSTVPGQEIPPGTNTDGQLASLPPFEKLSSAMTIVYPRIPNHPLLKNLDSESLRFWREDHITTQYTFEKPSHITSKSILDGGAKLAQTPLIEIPYGKGVVIAMNMPVFEQFSDQPAAGILLRNLLEYADGYRGREPKNAGVLADTGSGIATCLKGMNVKFTSLSGQLGNIKDLSRYGVILVDGQENMLRQLVEHKQQMTQYIQSGGVIWLHNPQPNQAGLINAMLPVPVTWKELKLQSPINVLSKGLLAGVSNDELFWPDRPGPLMAVSERVARFTIELPQVKEAMPLTQPSVAVSVQSGSGQWLIDMVSWESETAEVSRARRFVLAVISNLGIQIQGSQLTEKVNPAFSPEKSIPIPGLN
jgi:hypothetical protein